MTEGPMWKVYRDQVGKIIGAAFNGEAAGADPRVPGRWCLLPAQLDELMREVESQTLGRAKLADQLMADGFAPEAPPGWELVCRRCGLPPEAHQKRQACPGRAADQVVRRMAQVIEDA